MTDKELIQALRKDVIRLDKEGCIRFDLELGRAADRLEALMAEKVVLNELYKKHQELERALKRKCSELEQQLVNVEQDRLQIRLELDLLKAHSWAEYCEDLHEYYCRRVKQLQKENACLRETVEMNQRWVSVEERLPECEAECIVVVKFKYDWEKDFHVEVDLADYVQEDGYIDNHWNTINDWYDGQQYMHVTHWMPLPSTEGVE